MPLEQNQAEVTDGTILCPRCKGANKAESFFCYTCGKYFADVDDEQHGDRAKKPGADELPAVAPKARMVMPGGYEIWLTGNPTFIERSDFDNTLPHDILMSISRQHILITCDGRIYYIQDYGRDGRGSTNHTRLNDVDIFHKGRQPLKDGDVIELSNQPELKLTFRMM